NSPPTEVFVGDTVPFGVEIKNLGAYSTTPQLWLHGHDQNIIKLGWNGVTPGEIDARDDTNPVGGFEIYESNNVEIALPAGVDSYGTNMKLTVCYPYKTFASAAVCIDPDPTNSGDDACAARDVSLSGGQGGPVGITNIAEDSSKDKVRFTITISNLGGGTVYKKSDGSPCTNLRANEIDIVSVKPQAISGHQLSCKPEPVRLVNGHGIVYCEAPMEGFPTSAFTTVLRIDLDYYYKSSISKSINVRRI
ncbi:hypothetical protein KY320_03610, partial [Candidatus Woesearchaeota archaeon]|nr:hypothetical protein [Candidatus Woesearchaeota archaeon]